MSSKDLVRGLLIGIGLALIGTTSISAETGSPIIRKSYSESKPGTAPTLPVAKGAPNIIWVMLDDVGYGASSTFGGGARTPVLDSLANEGLKYTNFHNTAVCSPSRAAALTGRNDHTVGMGLLPQKLMSAEFPGYTGRLQPKDGTIADYLRARGYSTYMLGKWHLTPDEEATDLGPFDRWPTGKGFDHWLGFLGGAADQYKPDLVEDNQHVKPDGRHLTTQLTDKAISYIDLQQKLAPEKPRSEERPTSSCSVRGSSSEVRANPIATLSAQRSASSLGTATNASKHQWNYTVSHRRKSSSRGNFPFKAAHRLKNCPSCPSRPYRTCLAALGITQ